ncbi:hypothetical protein PHO31112_02121 [Pandoraea horticolens]|uniref:Uncharacterized protein n=1 Tax=Pandoraea horticolens TaxID=2508298 RepID=A0A5E4ULJ6_9BURK|nr:hypothetical protein PHO31112_02121 [Pandoraea horticolens]
MIALPRILHLGDVFVTNGRSPAKYYFFLFDTLFSFT